MENGNIISFEEYRKKKSGQPYKEDALSQLFKKDLREQGDLIGWYQFHKRFNKYKLFVHCLFKENHQERNVNPNSGFLIAYNKKQILSHTSFLIEAVEWEKRDYVLLKSAGKTYRQLSEKLSRLPVNTNYDAHRIFEDSYGSVERAPGNRCLYPEPDGKQRGGADAASLGEPLVMQG
ncbi:MAG: hypothetical protein HQ573_05495 [Desulfobacteraceae bacterium]|nr:hypothetical protein [Desulfobacteraceae bacterium]